MSALDYSTAESWLTRWDDQQQRYVADREERFAVIEDVVRHATAETPHPVIVDLGCGPGSLAGRLAKAMPHARIIGVDADPVLLGLANAYYPANHPNVEFAEVDLADPEWARRAGIPERIDASVSTTALHWMEVDDLGTLYERLAELTHPSGVFVNGDHLGTGSERLDKITHLVRARRGERVGVTDNEEWQQWWDGVRADDTLASLVDQRSDRAIAHGGSNDLSVDDHAGMLRKAGFAEVGPVWQSGDDTVLVGLR